MSNNNHRDFLFEIGTEEIPARFVGHASRQLQQKVKEWLEQQRVSFESIETYETPRRFAVVVRSLAEKQADINEEARGPAKKIAVDEEGNWTKAALGFARGQGVQPEDLYVKEIQGVEYIFARKKEEGRATSELLPDIAEIVHTMQFPKNMRWADYDLRFVRPIRWLVALFGEEVIPMEITGAKSGRTSKGHRFLGQDVSVTSASSYMSELMDAYVIVDSAERENRIRTRLKQLEEEKGWHIPIDEDLLQEVVHLVEYPTALYGTYEQAFLELPEEVLITTMREHQRYFPVRDREGKLLPYFVTVRNGDDKHLDMVSKGNEKVLRARLSDARFFYDEDRKMPIDKALSRLESVVFHEDLGTIGDKVRRIREISSRLAEMLQLSQQEVKSVDRVAEICKFDLVTNMVYEFPELQGIMGEYYARHAGETNEVARGIFEHYLPRFAGDELPQTTAGSLVSIADKLDTIIACFSIGIVPTGSQDPYALRRQAAGVVQILLERDLPFTLDVLFDSVMDIHAKRSLGKRSPDEIKKDLYQFFVLRVKNLLQERKVRYDVIDALLSNDLVHITQIVEKADYLMERLADDSFKGIVESFNRTFNLAQKAEGNQSGINPDLFEHDAEKALYDAIQQITPLQDDERDELKIKSALQSLEKLKPFIDEFFDQVMVMVDDEKVKNNRLSLLKKISDEIRHYADFNKLVFA